MMGIYLPNMEMPKKLGAYSMKIRLFVREDGTASIWGLEEYIPHEPLDVIPIPPHGRLIDADELFKEMERNGWYDNADRDIAEDLVLDAPTIIEAEDGE